MDLQLKDKRALVTGALVLRTKGIFFIMVTLAFAQMLYYLFHDTKLGGGSDGIYLHARPSLAIGDFNPLDLAHHAERDLGTLRIAVAAALEVAQVFEGVERDRADARHALAAARAEDAGGVHLVPDLRRHGAVVLVDGDQPRRRRLSPPPGARRSGCSAGRTAPFPAAGAG